MLKYMQKFSAEISQLRQYGKINIDPAAIKSRFRILRVRKSYQAILLKIAMATISNITLSIY
jgi:hypothetical protein